MFEFQNPAGFLLLLLIPFFYFLRLFKFFKPVTFSAVLSDWEGEKFEWKGYFRAFLSVFSKILILAGFILIITAFADPVITKQEKVYTDLGTDIIFVLDTSPSMAAKDINNERRIDQAKSAIKDLISEHEGYRFGLVSLGSNACVQIPPTNDLKYFSERLSNVKVGDLGNGSAIGDGLSTAICHLAASTAPKKCIILLTDGENNAGEIHPETAAQLASENSITLYVVGIGTKGNVPIEYTDSKTGKVYSGYLESDFNTSSLQKIASEGKGRYFEAKSIEDLSTSLKSIAKNENVNQNFVYKTVTTSLYRRFVWLSLILLTTAWLIKHVILQDIIKFKYKKILILKSVLIGLSILMLLLSSLGLTWGTYLLPVNKTSSAVSFVIDISNSMNAKDGENGKTRLESAASYAELLLEKMDTTPVSVVLSKGDGIAAIPLTQDYSIIASLLDVVSSNLMTVPGTSLAKGILSAAQTFPSNISSKNTILVFTDGEETDGQLQSALCECIKKGISVTIIGFGEERTSKVLAGDNKTYVDSALQAEKIVHAITEAKNSLSFYKNQTPVYFVKATDKGSAVKILKQIQNLGQDADVAYEARPVPRYKLFLILSIILFAAGKFVSEFDFKRFFTSPKKLSALLVFAALFLNSCKSDSFTLLKGTFNYQKKQYKTAISSYLDALHNSQVNNNQNNEYYALFDLGTAYSALGEDDAALEKFSQISEDAPAKILYSTYYNSGIIAHKNGHYEDAQNYFRKALEIDNTKIEAKINLELSSQMVQAESRQKEIEVSPVTEEKKQDPGIQDQVFKHIKENDKKQWKNSETTQTQNLATDY